MARSTRATPVPPNMEALTSLFTSMQEQLSTANCRVAKLTENNYTRWKRDMTVYFQDVGLSDIIAAPPPENPAPEWTRRDHHTLAIIHNCCDPPRQDLFADCTHAYLAWERLKTTFESRDPATVRRLYLAFNNIRKSPDETMMTYISRVKTAALQLTNTGENVSTTVLLNTVIGGLGDQYDAVKVYLGVDPALTEARLTQVLLSEESRLLARRLDRSRTWDRDYSRRSISPRRPRSPARQRSPNTRQRSPNTRRSPSRHRSPARHGRGSRFCPTCNMFGHDESTCYRIHPELLARRRAEQREQRRPASPRYTQRAAYAEHSSSSSTESTSQPSQHSHGYALPVQLDDDSVWDYYHTAMILESCDMASDAALDALHKYNIAIATGVGCWSVQSIPPPSPTAPLKSGDYIPVPQIGQWLIDSGASNHFTSARHLLSDYRDCREQKILTGNGYIVAKGIGNVTIHSSVGLRTIFDVLYVPDLAGKHNLLSIPQLVRKGCKITMTKNNGCTISSPDGSVVLLQGSFTGKGFVVDMSTCRTSSQVAMLSYRTLSPGRTALLPTHLRGQGCLTCLPIPVPQPPSDPLAMLAGTEDVQPVEIWHMRLGHLNQAAIQQLTTLATGLKIGPSRAQTLSMKCDPCLRGSQHKNISYQRGPGATKRLEHVWADVKGPLLDKDVYGFRYFCTFICEFTRWTVEYPLLHKNHVFGAYKLFESRYERRTSDGEKIVYLHIDNGPEYLTNDFRTYLRNKGVALCVTQPYSPEMNSIAERAMRTIIEHASAMLWNASLPVGFWSQAVETSVYLLNRSPHSALGRTPYEAWHGNKPNLGHLRIFGCRAAAHVPNELRTKTDWTSKSSPECIFIGYSETENLFKLWDVLKRDVIRKRDVIFWEHEMGHPSYSSHALTFGVSICADIGVAGALADSQQDNLVPPQNETPDNPIPLLPIEGRQTIEKLAPEPVQQNTWRFIPYEPPVTAAAPPNIRRPHLTNPPDLLNEPPHANAQLTSTISEEDATLDLHLALAELPDAFSMSLLDDFPPIHLAPLDRDIPNNFKQAMKHPRSSRWKKAMETELSTLEKNDTWELVNLPPGRKAFPNKWVFSYVGGPKLVERLEKEMKLHNDGTLTDEMKQRLDDVMTHNDQVIEKARLVARGDLQKQGIDYTETYAPVVKCVSLRILLVWAAHRHLVTRHWDIVSAFLHGNLDIEVFMQQPQGFADGTNRVCRLKKALYGLCQAARQFYIRLDEILRVLNFKRLAADWAIWIRAEDGAFIAVHVDDMAAAASTASALNDIANLLGNHLELKDLGEIRDYLGITIHRDGDLFLLSQEKYVTQLLIEYGMDSAFGVHTPVLDSEKSTWNHDTSPLLNGKLHKQYQALIGSLLYLMHATRPDLAFPVIRLSQYSSNPRECHWLSLKRILRYLKYTSSASLVLGTTAEPGSDLHGLIGYFDAAHADTHNRRSTCGYLFLLFGSPISWASKVQRTVALSTTEAELMAGTEAAREAIWIKSLTDTLFGNLRCELRGDNQGALALAVNPVYHQRTKHIDIRHRFICEVVNDGLLTIQYVPAKDMLADSLTKPLPRDTHIDHCQKMGLRLQPVSSQQSIFSAMLQRKRKWKCDDCGNLFKDELALNKHKLKKES